MMQIRQDTEATPSAKMDDGSKIPQGRKTIGSNAICPGSSWSCTQESNGICGAPIFHLEFDSH